MVPLTKRSVCIPNTSSQARRQMPNSQTFRSTHVELVRRSREDHSTAQGRTCQHNLYRVAIEVLKDDNEWRCSERIEVPRAPYAITQRLHKQNSHGTRLIPSQQAA
jgi:hypothetical protein